MNWLSFKMKGMYSYCVHKIHISSIISNIQWHKLHIKIAFKGSCKEKYVDWTGWTHDVLVNDVDGIFQRSIKVLNSQEVICILFNNPKCGQFTRIKSANLHEHKIHSTWTPTKLIYKDIQIGSNSFHTITKPKFPIQLAAPCTIHRSQGLTFDYLTFDPTNIYKHGLTYTTFFHVKKKIFSMFFNIYKWFFFKLIQGLPWRYANFKPWHDGMYVSPNHICFVVNVY
jgi:hypothetical protein